MDFYVNDAQWKYNISGIAIMKWSNFPVFYRHHHHHHHHHHQHHHHHHHHHYRYYYYYHYYYYYYYYYYFDRIQNHPRLRLHIFPNVRMLYMHTVLICLLTPIQYMSMNKQKLTLHHPLTPGPTHEDNNLHFREKYVVCWICIVCPCVAVLDTCLCFFRCAVIL